MLILIFAGFLAGIITGLIPGLHVNLLILALPFLPESFTLFILALAITHTFVDFIPSILQGAPSEKSYLIPAQELFLQGKAKQALSLTVFGGFFSVLSFSILFIPLLFLLPLLLPYLNILTIFVLFFFLAFLSDTKNPIPLIFSSILGILTFYSSPPNFLFCLIAGFFGLGTNLHILLFPTQSKPQSKKPLNTNLNPNFPLLLFSSLIVSIFPGIGSANAYSLTSKIKNLSIKEKLFISGGTNTSSTIFSLLVLFTLGKTRTGLTIMLNQLSIITPETIFLYLTLILFIASIASLFTLNFPLFFPKTKKINLLIIFFLLILTLFSSNLIGFLIFLSAGTISLYTSLLKVRRSTNMSSILVPVLFQSFF